PPLALRWAPSTRGARRGAQARDRSRRPAAALRRAHARAPAPLLALRRRPERRGGRASGGLLARQRRVPPRAPAAARVVRRRRGARALPREGHPLPPARR